jgi:ribulose-5-phosphate 4-epimerase/fuculose-1-phosphate aldolase
MRLDSIKTGEDLATVQWQARVDLAAAHRLAIMHGLYEGMCNHLTFRIPGTDNGYYQIPFGLHWSEVTASCFMEVGYDRTLLAGDREIEDSCYYIHAPMHQMLPRAVAVFHTHMPFASALARLEGPHILPIGHTELGTVIHMAYDDCYVGPARSPSEGERLARVIGDRTALIMANHGVTTIGETVAEAYDRLYFIENVARLQLYAMWTENRLKYLPPDVVETTMTMFRRRRLYGGKKSAVWHFEALKRMLDRTDADYQT